MSKAKKEKKISSLHMDTKTQGYILKIPASRIQTFHEFRDIYGYFAEPVPPFSHSRGYPLVAFVSDTPKNISYIAVCTPGHTAGSNLRRLNIDKLFHLDEPIRFSAINNRIPRELKHHVRKALNNGGILSPKSFLAFIEAILKLSPQTEHVLEQFTGKSHEVIKKLSPRVVVSLAMQKEAINTALHLAGIKRDHLLKWKPERSISTSFLDGLPKAYLREDALILNDMNYIPGMEKIKSSIFGVAQFNDRNIRLDVIYTNRTELEKQTGTDLIYYNAKFRSFVMVQYKAMEQSAKTDVFRLPNELLADEISRMDKLLKELNCKPLCEDIDGFRLMSNPFFIKLCKRIVLNPDSVELTLGMYFALEHWKLLENHPGIIGPRGGKAISYNNAGRHLNNDEFASLMKNAWIGTTPVQSALLEPLISQVLQTGKAVVLAIESKR